MANKMIKLRIAFWWGIIADALSVLLMLFPNLFVRAMNFNLTPDINLSFGLLYGVPLMIGWTILLWWGNQQPVERKAILLLTLPVVAGYILVEFYAVALGLARFDQLLPVFISQAGMCAMFIHSWRSDVTHRQVL